MRTEYWRLVHDLMERGWYRRGPEAARDADHPWWGFRFGHLTDRHPREVVRIPASDECSAMQALLTRLSGAHAS
ncbi:MAG TPA: hypothetical protein VFO85_15985 [Vicinamibacteria bacterium]|nr:hypothetical protein [Vicinamibacteria bacterium]